MKRLLIPALFAACAVSHAQIVISQVDDFQDGSLMNWAGGATLQNMQDGGPGGIADRFLQVTSHGGAGGGSRLATFNGSQWSGNYTAAGVSAIDVFLKNLGPTELHVRAVLFDLDGTDERWTSTVAHVLAPGSNWQRLTFSLAEADVTQVQGTGSYANLMLDVDRLMLRHQPGAPGAEGEAIAGVMGIDNVRAAVPEPATSVALLSGLALFARRRKRR
jgi:hypothetical protein